LGDSRIVNESVRLKLTKQPKSVIAEIEVVGIPRHQAKQNAEFWMGTIIKAFREITGRHIRPVRVSFAHVRTSDLREFERSYGCPVEFGAKSDQVEFSNETFALPLVTKDPHLLETLRPFAEEAAASRHTSVGSLRHAVENEVQRLLPHGRASAANVAKALAISARSLGRRLAAEGTTYADVIDQMRHSLALQYLKEPGFTSAQIAWLLGYESGTSFNHAFKRWTGPTPSAARTEKRLPEST
jgi:AraC-like DNA-binding protein